jgi:hypothetical protein
LIIGIAIFFKESLTISVAFKETGNEAIFIEKNWFKKKTGRIRTCISCVQLEKCEETVGGAWHWRSLLKKIKIKYRQSK